MTHPGNPKPHDWRAVLLEALRTVPVLQHACEVAQVERTTVWRAREREPEFAAAYDDAMEAGIDRAEQEAFRRAVVGYVEPVIDKGRLAYAFETFVTDEGKTEFRMVLDEQGQPVPLTVRKHSDALLALILKGRRKRLYAERIEQTGADGAPLIDGSKRSARVAALLAAAQGRASAGGVDDLV